MTQNADCLKECAAMEENSYTVTYILVCVVTNVLVRNIRLCRLSWTMFPLIYFRQCLFF